MEIYNVNDIYDCGEFVTITTKSGSNVHLPEGCHSITMSGDKVTVDLNEGVITPNGEEDREEDGPTSINNDDIFEYF